MSGSWRKEPLVSSVWDSKPAKIKARLMNINIAEEHAAEPVDFSARATAQVTMDAPSHTPTPGRRGSRRTPPRLQEDKPLRKYAPPGASSPTDQEVG